MKILELKIMYPRLAMDGAKKLFEWNGPILSQLLEKNLSINYSAAHLASFIRFNITLFI